MKTPLTILHIVGELNPNDLGGAEVHIVEVIRGLARKGHHQHVFVGQTDRCKVLFPFDNVTVHPVRCPQIPNLKLMLYIPAALRKIRRFLNWRTKKSWCCTCRSCPHLSIGGFRKHSNPLRNTPYVEHRHWPA
ncbi:MAG: hypothetical protein UW70_C0037G0011 [Candidatus Peregrinibacteria bacterium GW2011_GWA2_44_7]|nr:MAG: hypothetical protein UW70_C0037G0011 [Candidatus Peregrinibacteria bacterium GW2011_GWA2_44_7]